VATPGKQKLDHEIQKRDTFIQRTNANQHNNNNKNKEKKKWGKKRDNTARTADRKNSVVQERLGQDNNKKSWGVAQAKKSDNHSL